MNTYTSTVKYIEPTKLESKKYFTQDSGRKCIFPLDFKHPILNRAQEKFHEKYYNNYNLPMRVCKFTPKDLRLPDHAVFVNRLLLRLPARKKGGAFEKWRIPEELAFLRDYIAEINSFHYFNVGDRDYMKNRTMIYAKWSSFVYLTVRHGPISTSNDNVWHVDGFQGKHNMCVNRHLPEHNYLWVHSDAGDTGTEFLAQPFDLKSFDSAKYNVFSHFQKHAKDHNIVKSKEDTVYLLDPYVIHKRPTFEPVPKWRTVIRMSYIHTEVRDGKNTPNPHIPRNIPNRKDVRDLLEPSPYEYKGMEL